MWYASFGGVSGGALAALERAGAFGLTGRRRPRPEGAHHTDSIDPSDSAGCAPGPQGKAARSSPTDLGREGGRHATHASSGRSGARGVAVTPTS